MQALAGMTSTVIESRSRNWVPVLLTFSAAKGSGVEASPGPREADSDDEDAADGLEAANEGRTATERGCPVSSLLQPWHLALPGLCFACPRIARRVLTPQALSSATSG